MTSTKEPRSKPPLAIGLLEGALAGCGAAVFSNPFEVIKIRLQLQGELQALGDAPRHYKGTFHGLGTICRNEGLRGVQKGLGSAFCYQTLLNGTRLGLYGPLRTRIKDSTQGVLYAGQGSGKPPTTPTGLNLWSSLTAGYVTGFLSAITANPFFLVKTRLQSASDHAQVGRQHHYRGTMHALQSIYSTEGGLSALFHGSYFSALRTGAGSSVQLTSYDSCKRYFSNPAGGWAMDPLSFYTHVLASFLSSFILMIVMNPFDVVMTRVYNNSSKNRSGGASTSGAPQYVSFRSAIATIARTEGLSGLYKGSFAMWARVAPHTVVTFVLLEQLRKITPALYS